MAAPKRKTGNALGLTGGKARSSYALRGKPTKPSIQVDHDDKVAHKALVPPAEERTYPKALLKLAEGCPDLDVNSPKYDKLWEETKNIIGSKAIHGKGVNRIDRILRVFDLNSSYGPCTGMTRLERWERARDIGEEPPAEIADILKTRQGILDFRWSILEQDRE